MTPNRETFRHETTVFDTKNSLPERVRSDAIGLLQSRLSTAIDLMLQTKQAHWNIKGPQFIALHELFDSVHDHSRKWVDLIAERIVQLGGVAQGTVQVTAERSQLQEYPINLSEPREHIEVLSRSLAAFSEICREAIAELERIDDPVSVDIFVEISRSVDKRLWMVEAHNQIAKTAKAATKPTAA